MDSSFLRMSIIQKEKDEPMQVVACVLCRSLVGCHAHNLSNISGGGL
jgi:hypothetical protein